LKGFPVVIPGRLIALGCCCLLLGACATTPSEPSPDGVANDAADATTAGEQVKAEPVVPYFFRNPPEAIELDHASTIKLGSGQFINSDVGDSEERYRRGKITLNFKGANLTEFVAVVFEKILRKNYLIDPRVKGRVTLHTTYPVADEAIMPIVESVLQQNGAAVILQQGIYKVIPIEDAPGLADAPRVGRNLSGNGAYGIQIVPLRYVSAKEIEKVVSPMLPRGGEIRVDEARNLLILTASRYRLEQMLDTIRIFDVDWFKGMSFGLFRLQYAEAATLVSELSSLIGADGKSPLAGGIVKLVPIERLNAVLVVSHAPQYIDQMNKLINQFDWGVEGTPGRRLFVYRLKNSKADKLASVLQQIYDPDDAEKPSGAGATVAQLPPGERSNFSQPTQSLSRTADTTQSTSTGASGIDSGAAPVAPQASPGSPPGGEPNPDLATVTAVNIIAEPDSNSLLVMASPQDYRGIEAVIKQLDIAPRQVLIEANIAEVTLSDSLAYGVRWFMTEGNKELGLNAPVPAGAGGDGLTMATFTGAGEGRAFIDLLASKTAVNFLSAPQIMVLDNQTASIRVGDQIPVTVRNSQSTGDGNSPVVSEVQFRDTGTLLSVTPRINAGGQITLEISQEVSLPGSEPSVGGGGNVAISQRTIDSSVVVQSGETVLLGGLILETKNESRSGIPLLMDIPWLGQLFSSTSDVVFRTELIVMITPRVIENESAMRAVIEEMRGKMKKAIKFGNSVESVDL
jgi:general secretion pathway protein D